MSGVSKVSQKPQVKRRDLRPSSPDVSRPNPWRCSCRPLMNPGERHAASAIPITSDMLLFYKFLRSFTEFPKELFIVMTGHISRRKREKKRENEKCPTLRDTHLTEHNIGNKIPIQCAPKDQVPPTRPVLPNNCNPAYLTPSFFQCLLPPCLWRRSNLEHLITCVGGLICKIFCNSA